MAASGARAPGPGAGGTQGSPARAADAVHQPFWFNPIAWIKNEKIKNSGARDACGARGACDSCGSCGACGACIALRSHVVQKNEFFTTYSKKWFQYFGRLPFKYWSYKYVYHTVGKEIPARVF